MSKVVVLAFSPASKALPTIKRELGVSSLVVLVTRDGNIPSNLKEKVTAKLFDGYLSPQEYDQVNESTMKAVAQGLPYFRSHPELAPSYRGIPLWDVIPGLAFQLFAEVAKYTRITENIVEQEKPDKIIIIAAPGRLVFWYAVESVVPSGWRSKLISWLLSSGEGSLGDWTAGEVAAKQHVPTTTIQPGGALSAYLHRLLALQLFPPLFRLFIRYCEFRKSRLPVPAESGHSGSRPICLITHSRGHVRAMAPIARQLTKEGQPFLVIHVDGYLNYSVRRILRAEGLGFKGYERYLTGEGRRRARAGVRQLLSLWRRLEKDKAFLPSLDWQGLPLGEIARDRFYYMFAVLFPEVIKHIERANTILDLEKPGAIVLADDSAPMERSLALVARTRGIPSIQTTYGAYPNFSPVGSVDRTAAWGRAVKDFLIEHGLAPANSIEITGNPVSEADRQRVAPLSRADILRRLGIGEGKKVVLFTSQAVHPPAVTVELRERLLRWVYTAIQELPDYHFIVKLHPGEGFDRHHQLRSEMGLNNITVVKEWDLYELLKACDVLIASISGTPLEAMTMDRPVITVRLPGRSDQLPYAEAGVALGVSGGEDLVPAIRRALLDEETRQSLAAARTRFVLDYDGPQDGLAAKRVADLAIRMAVR